MRSKRRPVAGGGNGSALGQALFRRSASRTFATGCAPSVPHLFHLNRPETGRLNVNQQLKAEVDPFCVGRVRAALPMLGPHSGRSATCRRNPNSGTPQGIIKGVKRSLPLVACSLGAEDQRARLEAWRSLLASAASRAGVPGGMSYVFRPASVFVQRVRELAEAEHDCCTFLDFEIVEQSDELRLTVTSHPAGQAALRFIFA
jgi:hypothetical protein